MQVMKMCRNCGCLDWNKISKEKQYCSACETSDCCAHRVWVPVEEKDIKIVNIGGRNLRFYGGDFIE